MILSAGQTLGSVHEREVLRHCLACCYRRSRADLSGCGHKQELISIDIQPTTETFGASNIPVFEDKGAQVQLKALGTYIHPPVTKDITNSVTWSSNTPDMVTVDSTGVITATGLSCGNALISATVQTNSDANGQSASGAIVTGTMTANVVCFTGSTGGSSPTLTLDFSGNGSGSVTSSPPGLSCSSSATTCNAQFASGTTVTLTANAASGATFGSWSNCDTAPDANPCSLTLGANRTVTVTFN